jgi:kynurenine formamidase
MVLLKKNILLIEGLNLDKVEPGEYMLYALPLNFQNLEGGPARVILIN